jgi:hypothetical protein
VLIRNTEPVTFARMVYYNTKPLTRDRSCASLRFGGLLAEVFCAWILMVFAHLSILLFPVCLLWAMVVFLLGDTVIGTLNTLTELHVLDTMEVACDHGGEEGEEEGEPGDEGGDCPIC